jgi:hypothetical protein
MKIRTVLVGLFAVYDMIFNILMTTENVVNQTVHFVFLCVVLAISALPINGKPKDIQWRFLSWANTCYWSTMGLMYIYMAFRYPDWKDWLKFNLEKDYLLYFFMAFMLVFLSTWFGWKDRNYKSKMNEL